MNNIVLAIGLSGLLHATATGVMYRFFSNEKKKYIVAELDLSMAPLVPKLSKAGSPASKPRKPKKKWSVPSKKAVPTVPEPMNETIEEVLDEENSTPDIETEGDGDGPFGNGLAGDGSGVGLAGYRSTAGLTQKPRWVRNFITSADYPRLARKEGKDGVVVVEVFINTRGLVDDVKLVRGSYDILNEVALRKVKQARFRPAHDEKGRPVPCRVTLPIRFRLK